MKIAWYTSGHGFGHISRSSVVINALLDRSYANQIALMSPRADFLSDRQGLAKRYTQTDVGMVQKSSLDLDLSATKNAILSFEKSKTDLIKKESDFLHNFSPDIIVTDVSSLPALIGKTLGIPVVVIGNFTWDLIYQYYGKYDPFFKEYGTQLQVEYGMAEKRIVLPFNCKVDFTHNAVFTGVIGRKPTRSKIECRELFGFSSDKLYLLLSFGAYGIDYNVLETENLPDNVFLVVADGAKLSRPKFIYMENVWYPDLVAACDFVITKPGYGILSECYFADTPIIYTDRGDFPEYQFLVDSLNRYFQSWYISQKDLFALKLDTILHAHRVLPKEKLKDGLAEVMELVANCLF